MSNMSYQQAKDYLGDVVQKDGNLYDLGGYIAYRLGDDSVSLDGDFSVKYLRAILTYIENSLDKQV